MSRTLMVTGASGQLGRRVLQLLDDAKRPGDHVIAGTRKPDPLTGARRVDFDDLDSLPSAFAGVDRLLLISTDAVGPGKRVRQHQAAIAAAVAAGVKHIVYTSVIKPEGKLNPVGPDHLATEQALAASPAGHTILRNSLYLELLVPVVTAALQTAAIADATGDGRIARVSRDDCAAAAAAALVSGFDGRRTLDITGPHAFSSDELADIVSKVAGRTIKHEKKTAQQQQEALCAAGLPAGVAAFFVAFDLAIAAGEFDKTSSVVKELTARDAVDVETFVARVLRA